MHVLIYAGSDFYARPLGEDLVAVTGQIPSAQDIANKVQALMARDDYFEHFGGSLDWVHILAMPDEVSGSPLQTIGWKIEHHLSRELLSMDMVVCWQDSDGSWYGMKQDHWSDGVHTRQQLWAAA